MKSSTKATMNYKPLQDKTIVITGASSGAGRATAIQFARHGAKIVLAARNIEALDEVEAICREMGALALAVKTDVTDAEEMKTLAATAAEFGGSIDVWVNNAGVLAAGEFTETPIEIHDQVIRTNLMGYIHGAHAVVPYFKRQQYGVLINNISVGGWFPVPYGVGYSASKFGLRGFSEALRGELSQYRNIHVCDLFPAFLDTPGIQHAANYSGKILRPAPPVYDPQKVARSIVSIAQRPKKSVVIGSVTHLLRFAHFLLPAVTRSVTAKVVNAYLEKADAAPETSGNLFAPANYGTSIHGGWNLAADPQPRKRNLITSIAVTGIATGMVIFGIVKMKKKSW
ncbi:SDR family oxidoreductase [Segetibacter aerophilus]|nr:SDR family oxidoreductase [Segetibacter aerophilus]